MGRGKLQSALDNQKGKNIKVQKQQKYEKEARKRQAKRDAHKAELMREAEARGETITEAEAEVKARAKTPKKNKKDKANGVDKPAPAAEAKVEVNGNAKKSKQSKKNAVAEPAPAVDPEWETDDSEEDDNDDDDDMPERPTLDLSRLEDSESDISSDEDEDLAEDGKDEEEGDDDEEEEEEDEDDIPLSDLDSIASEDKGDIIPHQRLTINNTVALTAALKRIQLPYSKLAFSEHQSITTDEPVDILDIEDDLNRELAFYKQSLSSVKDARNRLKKEGVPFSRPVDYFAEMVKSDEHMGKIKQKLIDAAAGKKAAAEARKQRDLKKFGKQVQVAKLQERSKEKRDTMEKINLLKRKRQGADITATNEEDLFDVAINKEDKSSDRQRSDGGKSFVNKRQKKNEKFGFGGKKRHAKSNDAKSSADGRDFSSRKMKGKPSGGGASKRPGKARRAKMH